MINHVFVSKLNMAFIHAYRAVLRYYSFYFPLSKMATKYSSADLIATTIINLSGN